ASGPVGGKAPPTFAVPDRLDRLFVERRVDVEMYRTEQRKLVAGRECRFELFGRSFLSKCFLIWQPYPRNELHVSRNDLDHRAPAIISKGNIATRARREGHCVPAPKFGDHVRNMFSVISSN